MSCRFSDVLSPYFRHEGVVWCLSAQTSQMRYGATSNYYNAEILAVVKT